MRKPKLLPIWFCSHCTNIGMDEQLFRGCQAKGKFVAFDDQEDLSDIPDWCPLEEEE